MSRFITIRQNYDSSVSFDVDNIKLMAYEGNLIAFYFKDEVIDENNKGLEFYLNDNINKAQFSKLVLTCNNGDVLHIEEDGFRLNSKRVTPNFEKNI